PRRCAELRADGARTQRLRGARTGLPAARTARRTLRWRVRQCLALPCSERPPPAGARATARGPQAAGRAVQLESAGRQPARLEWRALRRLSWPRRLATP